MEDFILEKECDMPENWTSNTIFIKNDKGEVVEVEVPDDKEG